jgi:hypothetical protein
MSEYVKIINVPIPEKLLQLLITADWQPADGKQKWVQYQLLNLFKTEPGSFPMTLSGRTWTGSITKEVYDTLKNQHTKMTEKFGKQDAHLRWHLSDKDLFPKISQIGYFKTLQKFGPNVSMQGMTTDGDGLFPHTDLYRKSTLFYLLEGADYETVWYDYPTDPHVECNKYGFKWNLPDPDCLVEAHRTILQPHTWYLFDNISYHRVQPIKANPATRKSLCIEFHEPLSVMAEKLVVDNI